ncbi:hypothetical protein [Mycobacterium sp. C31M]
MAVVTDPNGVQWSVHRRWWPFWNLGGFALEGLFGLVMAAPCLVLWPMWLVSKWLGARWRIVVVRHDTEVETRLVRGWRASGASIDQLALQIARGWRSGHFSI